MKIRKFSPPTANSMSLLIILAGMFLAFKFGPIHITSPKPNATPATTQTYTPRDIILTDPKPTVKISIQPEEEGCTPTLWDKLLENNRSSAPATILTIEPLDAVEGGGAQSAATHPTMSLNDIQHQQEYVVDLRPVSSSNLLGLFLCTDQSATHSCLGKKNFSADKPNQQDNVLYFQPLHKRAEGWVVIRPPHERSAVSDRALPGSNGDPLKQRIDALWNQYQDVIANPTPIFIEGQLILSLKKREKNC